MQKFSKNLGATSTF